MPPLTDLYLLVLSLLVSASWAQQPQQRQKPEFPMATEGLLGPWIEPFISMLIPSAAQLSTALIQQSQQSGQSQNSILQNILNPNSLSQSGQANGMVYESAGTPNSVSPNSLVSGSVQNPFSQMRMIADSFPRNPNSPSEPQIHPQIRNPNSPNLLNINSLPQSHSNSISRHSNHPDSIAQSSLPAAFYPSVPNPPAQNHHYNSFSQNSVHSNPEPSAPSETPQYSNTYPDGAQQSNVFAQNPNSRSFAQQRSQPANPMDSLMRSLNPQAFPQPNHQLRRQPLSPFPEVPTFSMNSPPPLTRLLETIGMNAKPTDEVQVGRDRTISVLGMPIGPRDGLLLSPMKGLSLGKQNMFGPIAINDKYNVNWDFLDGLSSMFAPKTFRK